MVTKVEAPSQLIKNFFGELEKIEGASTEAQFGNRLSVIWSTYPGEPEAVYFSWSQGDNEIFDAVMTAARSVGLITAEKSANRNAEYELLNAAMLEEHMYNMHPGDPMGACFEFLPTSFWEKLEAVEA
jgi:hypothetical protein